MAQKKVVVLDTAGSTLDVPQGTDTYLMAEDVAITGNLSITGSIANAAGDTTIEATDASTLILQQSGTADVWISGGSDVTLVSGSSSIIVDSDPSSIITVQASTVTVAANAGDVNLQATGKIVADCPIFMTEQAAADADVAGKGQFWVKTVTPNVAMFTDDAGTDWTLSQTVYNEVFTSDVATVADQDYVLWYDAPWPGTVTMVRTDCASGTCTLTGKVNTTALGGTANSVSSTATEQTHSTSNTFVKGDKLQYTISSNSACLTMAVAFYITRTG